MSIAAFHSYLLFVFGIVKIVLDNHQLRHGELVVLTCIRTLCSYAFYLRMSNLAWDSGCTCKCIFILSWTLGESVSKNISGFICRLAHLHEAIKLKVVHRDIKSSNILIDDEFNAKISDFGLAKLPGAEKSHIAARVMGTFGWDSLAVLV